MHRDGEDLTTGEAAGLCGVTSDTVLRWVKSGRLRAGKTAGGHYRIPAGEVAPWLRSQAEPSQECAPRPLHCWEYNSRQGEVGRDCRECIVYHSATALCFRLLETGAVEGLAKRHCRMTCDQCAYYRRVNRLPAKVLVITPDPGSMAGLKTCDALKICFASNAYEASAVIPAFRPGFVIIDGRVGFSEESELIRCLVNDLRLPGLRVLLTSRRGARGRTSPDRDKGLVLGVLPDEFDAACVEGLINSIPVPDKPPGSADAPK